MSCHRGNRGDELVLIPRQAEHFGAVAAPAFGGGAMISFVGAGPGAADLITLRGAQRLAQADVVIWAASLVPEALLEHCRVDAVFHDSKTMNLDQVCAVFAAHPAVPVGRCPHRRHGPVAGADMRKAPHRR